MEYEYGKLTEEQQGSLLQILGDYEQVKPHLALRLMGRTDVRGFSPEYTHQDWLDLKLGYQVLFQSDGGCVTSTLIRERHRQQWGVSVGTLHRDALENTPRILPPDIFGIEDFIRRLSREAEIPEDSDLLPPPDAAPMPLYVLTNRARYLGAACLLYPGITDQLAGTCGGGFYILPSSIHELILMPESAEVLPEDLESMVREINLSCTPASDRLSDHVYLWRPGDVLPHRACSAH